MNRLRFDIQNDSDAVRIEIAGNLAGADVEAVYQGWQNEVLNGTVKSVVVDMTSITEADKHGRALLLMMHRFGADIIAESHESAAIARPLQTAPVESEASKTGWFGRLVKFFRDEWRTESRLSAQA